MKLFLFTFAVIFCLFISVSSQQSTAPVSVHGVFPVDRFVINLDLPPEQRWRHILSIPKYQNLTHDVFNTLLDLLPEFLQKTLWDAANVIGNDIERYIHQPYASELKGAAKTLNLGLGDIVVMNLFYEFSALCTSIVAQDDSGTIYHARNLDFGQGWGFTHLLQNMTIQVDFQQSNKTVFTATTYAGYIGVLTGMRPHVFAVTVNERNTIDFFGNLVEVINDIAFGGDAVVLSFLLRDLLTNATSYAHVKDVLTDQTLFADVYLTISGSRPGEGAVITRDRSDAANVWSLDPPSTWFLVQTNDDHWLPPTDARRDTAIKGMKDLGREKLSFGGLLGVLSTKPVLNKLTTYSTLLSADNLYYTTYRRTCPDPCPSSIN